MNAPHPFLLLAGALLLLFILLYISFFPVAFRQCNQLQIIKTCGVLTGLGLLIAMLGVLLRGFIPAIINQILINVGFLILQYKFGRGWLQLSKTRAFISICIIVGLFILLVAGLIALLAANGAGH